MDDILVKCDAPEKIDQPRNLLISGEAGSGKSTLCQRILHQWANNRKNIQRLITFAFVIFIKASLIKNTDDNIYDYIIRELLPDYTSKDLRSITQEMHNTLFVVDGFDELNCKDTMLKSLLDKKRFPHATVLLTSRSGHNPELQYFTSTFRLMPLSPSNVTTFLRNLRSDDNNTLCNVNFDKHPLGAVIATPLFLWFYYLLGEDTFHRLVDSSRTDLFHNIIQGILKKAELRQHKTSAECKEAVEELQKIAFTCMKNDKLAFDTDISWLAANVGLVKVCKSMKALAVQTFHTFTHKSFLEFLTAQYLVSQTSEQLLEMLYEIPEIRSASRRQTSLLIYFVCGLLNEEQQLKMIFDKFVPCVGSSDEHANHFPLQCLSECKNSSLIGDVWRGRVHEVVEIWNQNCTQYCVLGLRQLTQVNHYKLRCLKLSNDVSTLFGSSNVIGDIFRR